MASITKKAEGNFMSENVDEYAKHIAEQVITRLRIGGVRCFSKGSYHDISYHVEKTIIAAILTEGPRVLVQDGTHTKTS